MNLRGLGEGNTLILFSLKNFIHLSYIFVVTHNNFCVERGIGIYK